MGDGEEPERAIYRELFEETGIPDHELELIQKSKKWYGYGLPRQRWEPKFRRGQVQKWFFLIT